VNALFNNLNNVAVLYDYPQYYTGTIHTS